MVVWKVLGTRELLRRERELELRQPQVEREHVQARQQVERWQPGVLSRNYRSSPREIGITYLTGSFDSRPFFHPPIMRPSSLIFSEIRIYFLLSRAFISHETWRKNFRMSIFLIAKRMVGNLSILLS